MVWNVSSISNWALCDGNNGTPDLRNQFIIAAHSVNKSGITSQTGPTFNATTGALNESGQYEPGDVGGETAHQLTIAELANHNHTNGMGGNCESGGQSQSAPQNTGFTGGDNYHENRPPYYALALYHENCLIEEI